MHPTAIKNAKRFFDCYAQNFQTDNAEDTKIKVVEIGSQDVNGSLRSVCPSRFEYIGVDFTQAKGVDIVLTDPYSLPFEDGTVDMIISSSCFEHSEMFWLVFLEVLRVLKPLGLFYLNVPSAGQFHRYPVDCWRFYPDSGRALVTWGKRSGYNPALLESYTQVGGNWNDYVAVYLKDEQFAAQFKSKIIDSKQDFENGQFYGNDGIERANYGMSYEQKKLAVIAKVLNNEVKINM